MNRLVDFLTELRLALLITAVAFLGLLAYQVATYGPNLAALLGTVLSPLFIVPAVTTGIVYRRRPRD